MTDTQFAELIETLMFTAGCVVGAVAALGLLAIVSRLGRD